MSTTSEHNSSITESETDLPFVNIAAYLFVSLDRLPERREQLRNLCKSLQLKGTILLTPEGINLFMAGLRESIDSFLAELRSDPLLAKLETKESYSHSQPFSRLLIKIKKEIIAFGVPGIDPARRTSPKLPARELKAWLDEGRPLILLDTRNDYEVELGTFHGALPIGVDHFRDFPEKVRQLPEEMKTQPIVMFCTGGIRCEKAGPFMEQEGFQQIYQLEGGILKYFEECGSAHYDGDCFVFDHRVALDPGLTETATTQCYRCQHPLTDQDQQSEQYQLGVYCPYCFHNYQPPMELTTELIRERLEGIGQPLPGSKPYTNRRPLNVPQQYGGYSLIDFLCAYHPHLSRETWQSVCDQGLIQDRNGILLKGETILRPGQRLIRLEPDTVEPDVNPQIRLIAWNDGYAVFEKPAPLPMHPCGRFHLNTMTSLLDEAFPEVKFRPAHRLDANTTGVVVFSIHRDLSRKIQRQFEKQQAQKRYLCRVIGQPAEENFTCDLPLSSQPDEQGLRGVDETDGLAASTEFRVLHRFEDGTSLVEAIPKTGRTNQIRVHLWALGFPIQGDPVYLPHQQRQTAQTLSVADPPMCLHAQELKFFCPHTGEEVTFTATRPDWAAF